MQYTINQLREEIFKPVFDVYAIFQNFFGEDKTDLQRIPTDDDLHNTMLCWDVEETEYEGVYEVDDYQKEMIKNHFSALQPIIMVWWPEVTVSNEHNRSIIIYDLYARIEIKTDGTIPAENRGFQLNKTTYTGKQFASGYQHSHTPSGKCSSAAVASWQNPCLGRGPILSTITTLKVDYDEITWMLFCEELSLYVTVESLEGVPYIKLESVGGTKQDFLFREYMKDDYKRLYDTYSLHEYGSLKNSVKEFVLFYLQNGNLSLNYCNDHFTPGMPFYDYIIDISNSFIAWVNKYCTQEQCADFMQNEVLYSRIIKDGKFMRPDTVTEEEAQRYNGMNMLEFKGRQITLSIIPDAPDDENPITLLMNPNIAMFILQNILKIINYRFTNGHTTNIAEHSGTAETSAQTYKTVLYL